MKNGRYLFWGAICSHFVFVTRKKTKMRDCVRPSWRIKNHTRCSEEITTKRNVNTFVLLVTTLKGQGQFFLKYE